MVGVLTALFLLLSTGCKKFLDIPLPTDSVAADGAYLSDNSTSSVVSGIFSSMSSGPVFSSGANRSAVGFLSSQYSDELVNLVPTNTKNAAFYANGIQSTDITQWSLLYKQIYHCNLAIEGIKAAGPKLLNADQWLGEALFARAYLYFYVVNLFGSGPLAISSDYQLNNTLSRSPAPVLYQQILADLNQAKPLLALTYKDGYAANTVSRGRPNRSAVSALLARTYLYLGEWAAAEAEASQVIARTTDFQLIAPAQAFLANSRETIWALIPAPAASSVADYQLYNSGMQASVATPTALSGLVTVSLSSSVLALFDKTKDLRFTNWIRKTSTITPAADYYFPNKYKSNVAQAEFLIQLRLGEMYLIRAETRARMNDLSGAKSDLDALRSRAGLTEPSAVSTSQELIDAVQIERRRELFSECGHRFFDLKRTGRIDQVMIPLSILKGGSWASFKQFWPIPAMDIVNNPALTQTPGYN